MTQVYAAVPITGLSFVLVAVELVLEPGRLSADPHHECLGSTEVQRTTTLSGNELPAQGCAGGLHRQV
jgi:hypothetical protein